MAAVAVNRITNPTATVTTARVFAAQGTAASLARSHHLRRTLQQRGRLGDCLRRLGPNGRRVRDFPSLDEKVKEGLRDAPEVPFVTTTPFSA